MEVVVLAQAQWQEIAAPKTVKVSIFSCSIRTNAPSFMLIYLPEKYAVSEIHLL